MTLSSLDSEKFRRREWWLLIALLLALEYWIFSVSHAVSGEQAVVNYISFASSIASILLAIVAIIYSFVQGDGQRRTEGALASQVNYLQEASKQLLESKSQLELQLNRVDSFTQKMDGLHELVGGSFNNIEGSLSKLRNEIATNAKPTIATTSNSSASSIDKKEIVTATLSNTTFDADLLTYALHKYVASGKQMKAFEFLGDHFAAPLSKLDAQVSYLGYLSIGWQVLSTLRAFGLLTSSGDSFTLGNELKDYVADRGPIVTTILNESFATKLAGINATFNAA